MRLVLFTPQLEPVAAGEDPRAIKSAARLLGLSLPGNVAHVVDLSIYGHSLPVVRTLSPDLLASLGLT